MCIVYVQTINISINISMGLNEDILSQQTTERVFVFQMLSDGVLIWPILSLRGYCVIKSCVFTNPLPNDVDEMHEKYVSCVVSRCLFTHL